MINRATVYLTMTILAICANLFSEETYYSPRTISGEGLIIDEKAEAATLIVYLEMVIDGIRERRVSYKAKCISFKGGEIIGLKNDLGEERIYVKKEINGRNYLIGVHFTLKNNVYDFTRNHSIPIMVIDKPGRSEADDMQIDKDALSLGALDSWHEQAD